MFTPNQLKWICICTFTWKYTPGSAFEGTNLTKKHSCRHRYFPKLEYKDHTCYLKISVKMIDTWISNCNIYSCGISMETKKNCRFKITSFQFLVLRGKIYFCENWEKCILLSNTVFQTMVRSICFIDSWKCSLWFLVIFNDNRINRVHLYNLLQEKNLDFYLIRMICKYTLLKNLVSYCLIFNYSYNKQT